MNGFLVQDMLDNMQYHPYLLADIDLNAKALAAQGTLMSMLDALPEYSFVLQYIYYYTDQPVEVMACWCEYGLESLQYSAKSINAHSLKNITLDGGVYALTAWEDYNQYVGSTYNQANTGSMLSPRLSSHMSKFKQFSGPVLDLTDKYQWASVNGGLKEWKWFEVYRTFNFYMNFVQAYPLYPLTYGEYIILVSLSKFLPRLLEQSLFNLTCFHWNKAKTVNYDLRRWDPRYLNWHTWGPRASHVQIQDYHTREVLRKDIPSLSIAKDALGIRHTSWKPWYAKLPIHVDSKVLGRKVTILNNNPFSGSQSTYKYTHQFIILI